MSYENAPGAEKEERWRQVMESLDGVTDELGEHVDENIKEAVAGFILNGIPTSSSCGGHLEEGEVRFPYVAGKAKGMPRYRFVGEREILEGIARRRGLKDAKEVFEDADAEQEYLDAVDESGETDEYREWYLQNAPVREAVAKLVEEYRSSPGGEGSGIRTRPHYPGYKVVAHEDVTNEDDAGKRIRVARAQGNFSGFAGYLKRRFMEKE